MPVSERQVQVGVASGAAIAAALLAGYYGYGQWQKRYPKYKEQCSLFKEVGCLRSPQQWLPHLGCPGAIIRLPDQLNTLCLLAVLAKAHRIRQIINDVVTPVKGLRTA